MNREGWHLSRESEILFVNQHVFLPDFTFTHDDGRRVHLEIVGFSDARIPGGESRNTAAIATEPVLVAVAASTAANLPELPQPPLVYKTRIKQPEQPCSIGSGSTEQLVDHSPGRTKCGRPLTSG
jgi:hypothetical protein